VIPPEHVRRRLRWLAAAHLCLAATPMLWILVPDGDWSLPMLWAMCSVPVGGLMTLGFWVGMGRSRALLRIVAGLAGSAYLAVWEPTAFVMKVSRQQPAVLSDWISSYLSMATPYGITVIMFGGMFLLMRYRWTLTRRELGNAAPHKGELQFTVLNLLVIMSIVAVVLTLVHGSRGDSGATSASGQNWQLVAAYALGFVIYLINTACAAHAALSTGPIRRNILLVLLVSTLSGVALSLAAHQDRLGYWFVACGAMTVLIPTIIVIASLLVVRSCGFRLTRSPAAVEDQ
jgi:hypothetical protein